MAEFVLNLLFVEILLKLSGVPENLKVIPHPELEFMRNMHFFHEPVHFLNIESLLGVSIFQLLKN